MPLSDVAVRAAKPQPKPVKLSDGGGHLRGGERRRAGGRLKEGAGEPVMAQPRIALTGQIMVSGDLIPGPPFFVPVKVTRLFPLPGLSFQTTSPLSLPRRRSLPVPSRRAAIHSSASAFLAELGTPQRSRVALRGAGRRLDSSPASVLPAPSRRRLPSISPSRRTLCTEPAQEPAKSPRAPQEVCTAAIHPARHAKTRALHTPPRPAALPPDPGGLVARLGAAVPANAGGGTAAPIPPARSAALPGGVPWRVTHASCRRAAQPAG